MVVDDLIGGFGEEEVKMDVVFMSQMLVNLLCYRTKYLTLHPNHAFPFLSIITI